MPDSTPKYPIFINITRGLAGAVGSLREFGIVSEIPKERPIFVPFFSNCICTLFRLANLDAMPVFEFINRTIPGKTLAIIGVNVKLLFSSPL